MSILYIKIIFSLLIVVSISLVGISLISRNKKEKYKYKERIIKLSKKSNLDLAIFLYLTDIPNELLLFGLGLG